jgi:hypothetical protein
MEYSLLNAIAWWISYGWRQFRDSGMVQLIVQILVQIGLSKESGKQGDPWTVR